MTRWRHPLLLCPSLPAPRLKPSRCSGQRPSPLAQVGSARLDPSDISSRRHHATCTHPPPLPPSASKDSPSPSHPPGRTDDGPRSFFSGCTRSPVSKHRKSPVIPHFSTLEIASFEQRADRRPRPRPRLPCRALFHGSAQDRAPSSRPLPISLPKEGRARPRSVGSSPSSPPPSHAQSWRRTQSSLHSSSPSRPGPL